ncbi:unnamed protein product [Candidula unifasciata]|uniref:Uncharacterized protein n=1 Tax=Candidula unifasciata TaxID=100452 RepID=A0A8S3ZWC3_9EUPU|nr:unnamed protein product [Candidula unifasciata]
MQVSNAKIPHGVLEDKVRKRRLFRRRLGIREFLNMPCLLPATVVIALGLLAVATGAGMSVVGYVPGHRNSTNVLKANSTACAYIGPVLMAIGIFAMITACVFYCEVLDKYAILVPDKKKAVFTKEELYEFIIGEMKKSYAQTLITAYSKAAEHSRLLDIQSYDRNYTPEYIPYNVSEPLTLEQQIDIECEGYTPSPPIPNKRYSIIQARIQRLKSEDNWLKTSSLPNIRRSLSIKRASRVGVKMTDSKTLSCDYTMDEARLRRKSMMLRTIVQWNSGSSDMFVQKQRRFSSVKALPSYQRDSLEDDSQKECGSFPLTRLIERRGTFACGDMRTRRMKFLLLLEASESQEGFNDSVSADGRHTVAAIRRNSFIPYRTCDKFIAGEERKTIRDRRRSSVNPFSTRHHVNSVAPQPTTRRHSFYPIRRDTQIYIDPHEHRRHSFNPMGLSNARKPDFAGKMDGRRGSFNPTSMLEEIRPAHIPQQASGFLQRPSVAINDLPDRPHHSASDSAVSYLKAEGYQFPYQGFQDDRRIDRRHSFNPVARVDRLREGNQLRVPQITINENSPERRLLSPSYEICVDERERRHSFTPPRSGHSHTTSSRSHEKSTPPRISFNLEPSAPSVHLLPQSTQTISKPTLKPSKPSPDPVRPSSFQQEMVVFRPLKQHDSRSDSPSSNISCRGSEHAGSERSMGLSRTASAISDKPGHTAFILSPPSPEVANIAEPPGYFQQSPSYSKNIDSPRTADPRSMMSHAQQLSPRNLTVDISNSGSGSDRKPERKAASFCYSGGLGKTYYQHLDTPGSTNSGPAAFSFSTSQSTIATIHRSKSASALPGAEFTRPSSPHSAFSYARVPKPASPLVTRHKTRTRQHMDKRSS